MHRQFTLTTIETNGVTLRAVVAGEGPLVVLVHGWPELWYSWRYQIKPIAEAGFRVVAPDLRGYGGSDKPHAVEAYDMATLMADVVGVIDTLGEETAILIGHDWSAPIVWNTASLHEDRVSTQVVTEHRFEGAPIRTIYSGDTIVDHRYWGQKGLIFNWRRMS